MKRRMWTENSLKDYYLDNNPVTIQRRLVKAFHHSTGAFIIFFLASLWTAFRLSPLSPRPANIFLSWLSTILLFMLLNVTFLLWLVIVLLLLIITGINIENDSVSEFLGRTIYGWTAVAIIQTVFYYLLTVKYVEYLPLLTPLKQGVTASALIALAISIGYGVIVLLLSPIQEKWRHDEYFEHQKEERRKEAAKQFSCRHEWVSWSRDYSSTYGDTGRGRYCKKCGYTGR